MMYMIFTIYDRAAERYLSPWFAETKDAAKRIFAHNIKTIDIWNENPEQFELHMIGLFNDLEGTITEACNELICKGTDLVRKEA